MMQKASTQILRIKSKDGLSRVEVSPSDTIRDVKQKLAKLKGIPADNQQIQNEQNKSTYPDTATIASLGFSNGHVVILEYTGEIKQEEITADKKKLGDIKRVWNMKDYMNHLEDNGLVFKSQEDAHCKHASLDFESCNKFQLYLHTFAFQKMRIGYIYGNFTSDGGVTGDFIYEPDQDASPDMFVDLDSPQRAAHVDRLAELLGYQKVGWIFSHPPGREYIMSAAEVQRATELQAKAIETYGDVGNSFVTFKVTVNDEGMSLFEAFQVTDQCIKLYKANMFRPSTDPKFCVFAQDVLMHRQGAGRKDSQEVDTTVLLKPVAVKNDYRGKLQTDYVIEHRPDTPQTVNSLKTYLSRHTKTKPWVRALTDAHLLLALTTPPTQFLDAQTDLPALCEAVRKQTADPAATEGFKLIMESSVGLM